MAKYIALRLGQSIFVLFGLSLLIFFIARVVPGDPARVALGNLATEEQVQKLRAEMHLDRPFAVQYYYWLKSMLRGDLGKSLYTQRPVTTDLRQYIPATLELILFATLISLVFGQVTGVLAGYFRNSWFDNLSRLASYLGVATPSFVVAILLLFIFSQLLKLAPSVGRLPLMVKAPPTVTGFMIIDSLLAGRPDLTLLALKHLVLPAFSLAVIHIAQEGRITRSSLIENVQKDYIIAHEVHGIRPTKLVFKYLLKPSIIPTVTVMGLDFAFLMSNAFLVELVFFWPGFARYAVNAMLSKDLNAIVAVVLVIGVTFALVNLVVDTIITFLDPAIRIQRRGG
ncbi:MAG: ABC transporter permease [Candidatus Acetothermia bacterium]|jgi:peptide/nickel transport system permease protein|nr:ABC transporter permease [Candidatus Acetothermia bacterium]MDH7505454.1 ABC transporter permease [Candidatus Acetothermia bacterium]